MNFKKVDLNDRQAVKEMSALASAIVKEHYDPILGAEQNDYMIEKFQSEKAITEQIMHGYEYYFACDENGENVGFTAFYKRDNALYLSKLYLKKECRGQGYSRSMLEFITDKAKKLDLPCVELNVNKENFGSIAVYEHLGFVRIRAEKNDIGNGYFMDDYVYSFKI